MDSNISRYITKVIFSSIREQKIKASVWRRAKIRREQNKIEYKIYAEERKQSKEKFIRWKKNWYKQKAIKKLKSFYYRYLK